MSINPNDPPLSWERALLLLEFNAHDSFAKNLISFSGADHFLLFAGHDGAKQRLALSSPLPGSGDNQLTQLEFDPNSYPVFSELRNKLILNVLNVKETPLCSHFPDSEWAVIGLGRNHNFTVFLFGKGPPPSRLVKDPLLSDILLKRIEGLTTSHSDFENATVALSRLSHEFKTPLVCIKGYAELILDHPDKPLSPKVAEWTRRIAAGANRLAALFRKATTESRTNAAWAYTPRLIDPAIWIQSSIQEAAQLAASRDIHWRCSAEEGLWEIALDPEAGQDLLLELIQNAARATPDGGSIEIRLEFQIKEGLEGICLSIEDTGIGIPNDDNIERLFDKFTTLGNPMAHHSGDFEFGAGGIGLGLSLVRGIVRAHGGKVWAEGRGQDPETLPGAIFHVWLPISNSAPKMAEDEKIKSLGKLLIIEPDDETSKILKTTLSKKYKVAVAKSPEDGLDLWQNEGPWEACLVEPVLLEGDGANLIKSLSAENKKENKRGSASIIVYTTATVSEIDAWRAIGVDTIISKPARTRTLLQNLEEIKKLKTSR